ncbi:MAG TPA: hypothetical protein P5572_10485 [Phycisphaerae bacterium]|nr:hypothetical protein [Phycisphaerales bacterium]HRX85434.1 hypothetical protein [Phycisphaerae bacterium]
MAGGEKFVCSAALCAVIFLTGCAGTPPESTPTPSPSPTPDGNTGPHRLTLRMRSGTGTSRGMNVRVLVSNQVYTRANAPYSDGTVSRGSFSNNADPDAFEFDILHGSIVTLVAVEAEGGLPAALSYSDITDLIDPFAVEFLTWEGDVDATPEAGVATFTMNADRDVTAVFARMPQVLIRKYDENNVQLAGGCFDIEVEAAQRLGLPGAGDLSGTTEDVCCCIVRDNDANLLIAGQVKTGTQITLTANDANICDSVSGQCFENFVEWQGSAALCGASRECMLTVGVDVDLTAIWRDNSQ